MHNYLFEVEKIIIYYRDHINELDKMLAPHLSKISCEARQFIIEFMDAWNEAVMEKGLLTSYSQSAIVLQKMLDDFTTKHPHLHLKLYADISNFLGWVKNEKDNDEKKAHAEYNLLSDIDVLSFCYRYWKDREIEIDVDCYSEKDTAHLNFSFSISEDDFKKAQISDMEELYAGITDSYWENWQEFEPGIQKARRMINEGKCDEIKDALFESFGHFKVTFEIDGVCEDFEYRFDVDEVIYPLLEEKYLSN